ncbi:hypothetical protein NDU88_007999 [Pleurodeles waltl]|uniref:Uncharacterized protein n=1 Tax=Pleurodeles waltl TaxID=8319 RepID=A0AAV7VV36_PLEWA|nr:hypothetical protein NDU88_007999 [Pleurodeles waltl]
MHRTVVQLDRHGVRIRSACLTLRWQALHETDPVPQRFLGPGCLAGFVEVGPSPGALGWVFWSLWGPRGTPIDDSMAVERR